MYLFRVGVSLSCWLYVLMCIGFFFCLDLLMNFFVWCGGVLGDFYFFV